MNFSYIGGKLSFIITVSLTLLKPININKTCETVDSGFEDAFHNTVIGRGYRLLKSTNLPERLNQEVRRREKIIRIFPYRLIGAILMDMHEEMLSSTRKYIKFDQ